MPTSRAQRGLAAKTVAWLRLSLVALTPSPPTPQWDTIFLECGAVVGYWPECSVWGNPCVSMTRAVVVEVDPCSKTITLSNGEVRGGNTGLPSFEKVLLLGKIQDDGAGGFKATKSARCYSNFVGLFGLKEGRLGKNLPDRQTLMELMRGC